MSQVHVIRMHITTAVVEGTSEIYNCKLWNLVTHYVLYSAAILGVWVVTICHTVVSLVITHRELLSFMFDTRGGRVSDKQITGLWSTPHS